MKTPTTPQERDALVKELNKMEFEVEETYKIGDIITTDSGKIYLIAQVSKGRVNLIDIFLGKRKYKSNFLVENVLSISKKEMPIYGKRLEINQTANWTLKN